MKHKLLFGICVFVACWIAFASGLQDANEHRVVQLIGHTPTAQELRGAALLSVVHEATR